MAQSSQQLQALATQNSQKLGYFLQLVESMDKKDMENGVGNKLIELVRGMFEHSKDRDERICRDVSEIKTDVRVQGQKLDDHIAHDKESIKRVHKRIDGVTKPMKWVIGIVFVSFVTALVTAVVNGWFG